MSGFTMIDDEDFAAATGTREQQFVSLARSARNRLNLHIEDDRQRYPDGENGDLSSIKAQFVGEIEGLAEELGIDEVAREQSFTASSRYDQLQALISKLIAKYRLRDKLANSTSAIQLSIKGRGWIRQELSNLRKYVDESDLPKWKKKDLIAKLIEVEKSLDRDRLSYASIMAVLVPLSAVFGGSATGIANAPKAIDSIHQIIAKLGSEHAANEAQQLRLEGPPLMLEDAADDLDDDVPF